MKKICLFILLFVSLNVFSQDNSDIKTYVGVYLSDVSGFEISEGRFNADLIIWFKWFGSEIIPPFTFANGEITNQELSKEKDGKWHTVKYHIQGTFRGTFPLQKFPFDKQQFKIQIDIPEEYGKIVPDLAGSGMADKFSITGWEYQPYFKSEINKITYYSDFGSLENEGIPFSASSVNFLLDINRPILPYIIKFILPLLIVLLMSLVAYFISPEEVEANLGIGVTALLTCVALHFSLADSLPNVSYLVTIDKIFIVSYLLILFNVVESVVSFRISKDNLKLSDKIENISWKMTLVTMTFGFILIIGIDMISFENNSKNVKTNYISMKSTKDEVILDTAALKTLNSNNILKGLIYRGLYYEVSGDVKTPFLIEKIPALTNELVRFLKDGTVAVRWKLKTGLKWGDGSKITSEDLIFSINTEENDNRLKVEKIDNYTVDIYFKKRNYAIIDKFIVYPKKYFEAIFKEKGMDGLENLLFNNPPPMDGPYILKKFESEKIAIFEINPYFAGKKPDIKRIIYKVSDKKLPETIKNKNCDIGLNLGVESFEKIKQIDFISIKTDKNNSLYLLQPDTSIEPFNNLLFRKALTYAINRDKVRELLFGDAGEIAYNYRSMYEKDYNNSNIKHEYSLQKAKELLFQSGVNKPFKIIISKAVSKSPEMKVVESIYNDLIASGFKTEIFIHDASSAKLFQEGNHGGLLYTNRATNFDKVTYFWTKPLITNEVKNLKNKFDNTMFDERRLAVSMQLQEIWGETVPLIPLSFGVYRTCYVSNFQNWSPKAVSDNLFWNVEYWYFK